MRRKETGLMKLSKKSEKTERSWKQKYFLSMNRILQTDPMSEGGGLRSVGKKSRNTEEQGE
jgi:hypothetical protein